MSDYHLALIKHSWPKAPVSLWAFARLAQVQEPGRACGEAGGGNGDKLPHAFRLPHRFMGCRWRERHRALGWCRGPSSRDGDLRGRVPALAQGTNHLAPRLSSNRRQSPDSACVSAPLPYLCGHCEREERPHWQDVCKLILEESEVVAVSWQLRLALLKDAKLDVAARHA